MYIQYLLKLIKNTHVARRSSILAYLDSLCDIIICSKLPWYCVTNAIKVLEYTLMKHVDTVDGNHILAIQELLHSLECFVTLSCNRSTIP